MAANRGSMARGDARTTRRFSTVLSSASNGLSEVHIVNEIDEMLSGDTV